MKSLKDSVAFTKWIRPIIITVISTIIVMAVGFGLLYWNISQETKVKYQAEIDSLKQELESLVAAYSKASTEVSLSVVNKEIKEIGELATIEYLYTDVGQYENSRKLFDKNIPTTTKRIIAKWDGIIKAGIEVDNVKAVIDENNKKIIISLPQAKILSHELDENSFETIEEKDGLFNEIKVDDVRQMDIVSKEEMEKRAIENGILDKAYENAKTVLTRLMLGNEIIAKNYTVEFKTAE